MEIRSRRYITNFNGKINKNRKKSNYQIDQSMKKYLLLYLMFTFVLSQKVISQGAIIGTNMDGDLSTSVSETQEFDSLCHIHTISLTIPEATDSIYQVTNALINYTMISSEEVSTKEQRSKMFFVNTSTEEEEWINGIMTENGILQYERNVDIANGLYSSGTVLTFGMWAVRQKMGNVPGCNQDVTWVEDSSWTIEIEYSSIAIDTGAVGIGTLTPEPSSILDVKSEQRGFLPPRMSELFMQFIPNPAEGLVAYCTDCDPVGLYCMKGGIWVTVGSGGSDIFTKTGNSIHQKSANFNESFLFGRNALPDTSLINETFMFFDQPKAAFRGGLLTNESKPWQPNSLGVGSFAYGENLYAPSFGEIALGINNELYTPMSADTFHSSDRIFSIGIGTGVISNQGGKMKNAITVLKNGSVGIGDATPDATLDILGSLIVQRKLTSGVASGGIISVKGSILDQTTVLIEAYENSGKISLFNNIDIKAIEIDAKFLVFLSVQP